MQLLDADNIGKEISQKGKKWAGIQKMKENNNSKQENEHDQKHINNRQSGTSPGVLGNRTWALPSQQGHAVGYSVIREALNGCG